MKALILSLFTLVNSSPLVMADGCGSHGPDTTMACVIGQAWDDTLQACVDTNV